MCDLKLLDIITVGAACCDNFVKTTKQKKRKEIANMFKYMNITLAWTLIIIKIQNGKLLLVQC